MHGNVSEWCLDGYLSYGAVKVGTEMVAPTLESGMGLHPGLASSVAALRLIRVRMSPGVVCDAIEVRPVMRLTVEHGNSLSKPGSISRSVLEVEEERAKVHDEGAGILDGERDPALGR